MPLSGTWSLRAAHRLSAIVIAIYIASHIGNHIVGFAGQDAHVAYMAVARSIYRHPLVEPVLLALLTWQVLSGVTLVVRGWRGRQSGVAWLQAASGLYLAFFLINHVAAVLVGRSYFGLDTDFRYAAAGFFVPPWQLFFALYYFLAVFSLFAHVGCALYWWLDEAKAGVRTGVLTAMVTAGATLGLVIVMSLAGALYEVDIPPAYLRTFGG